MSAETSYDAGAPTIEVRIYREGRLLARELVETEQDAAGVVERWSDVENVYVLVDDLSVRHAPGDILAPDELPTGGADDDHSIDSAAIPGRGTE
jgi:hypothetical protein